MKLSILLQAIHKTLNETDKEIALVTDDSRACVENSVFVCHDAATDFIEDAKRNGAVAVVTRQPIPGCYTVENTRQAYSTLCRAFFGEADRRLTLVAVTGTNGKTTTATMLHHILTMQGYRSALLSTVTNKDAAHSSMTTLDSFQLHRRFKALADAGAEVCVMEASSQGLQQERLFGLSFRVAVFTNLTHDHLDYHKTFEAYRDAKLRLFDQCDEAVVNLDDPHAPDVLARCGGNSMTYSMTRNDATFSAKSVRSFDDGQDFALVGEAFIHRVRLQLHGDFNVENAMAALLAARMLGVSLEDGAAALRSFSGVKGRMELLDTNTPYRVMIDYAHTPDSLRRVLLTLRRLTKGKLILVFGCGGERDKEKRAEMGAIAAGLCDEVVLTSDNPRGEDPDAIIDDILAGMAHTKTPLFLQPDRKQAIAFSLKQANDNDLVLLCGKGHETQQILSDGAVAFDEREIVKSLLREC